MKVFALVLLMLLLFTSMWGFDTGRIPGRAALFSLMLPGGGQLYNQSYLKAIGVAGIEVYLISKLVYDLNRSSEYRDQANGASSSSEQAFYEDLEEDYFRRSQTDRWWLGTVVFLSMVDAYVDAHLYNYQAKKKRFEVEFGATSIRIGFRF